MDQYVVQGGCRLAGTVQVSGAKNSTLKIMAAALLAEGESVISGAPAIKDVFTMAEVLRVVGCRVDLGAPGRISITTPEFPGFEAPYDLVRQMRASIIVLGPLLARMGRARVALPGGCNIGLRKIDQHIRGLEILGAEVEVERGYIEARAERLRGAEVELEFPSVGATENILMASVLADGTTVIQNAAREPEIEDLADFLVRMGARIRGQGTPTIEVEGVARLEPAAHTVLPDRIEAGTFLVGAAMTGGEITVNGARPEHMGMLIEKLSEAGMEVYATPGSVSLTSTGRVRPVALQTLPYPGFPTDMQAPLMALLATAHGSSVVTENVFESRFMFIDELVRLGARVSTDGHHAVIHGVRGLVGAGVSAPDLRAGAALVLAGLSARGETSVDHIGHIDRGYENFEAKLRGLGANIMRRAVPETESA